MASPSVAFKIQAEQYNDAGEVPAATIDEIHELLGLSLFTVRQRIRVPVTAVDQVVAVPSACAVLLYSRSGRFNLGFATSSPILTNIKAILLAADVATRAVRAGNLYLTGVGLDPADVEVWILDTVT